MDDIQNAVAKAAALITSQRHATLATVNVDGTPHSTPFFFIYEADLSKIYIGSHPHSLHCQNLERTGEGFVTLYDSVHPKRGGLYLEVKQCHMLQGKELELALETHNDLRSKEGKARLDIKYYGATGPQRMYSLTPVRCWVLMQENGADDRLIRDYRHEVKLPGLA